ncbi:PREDICTED: transcription activator MSS11 isoform X1 [Drosophila arizonae]|uniref:Transcription activator MSS11 isoform X1 n=1 Tax=Drosophila arizonae TaxID=7263 RepID=A0ABM1NN02_DROAR|nr:PREDICTED: transcription activator MSS11 isoform X1 [Drosophila arizonae]
MEGSDEINASPLTQLDITTRLAALNRWQEEQKRLLEERQNNQRLMLGLEHRNMYQMLGLLHDDIVDENNGDTNLIENNDKLEQEQGQEQEQQHQPSSIQMVRHAKQDEDEGEKAEQCFQLTDISTSPRPAKPKKPFLRRGDGLKQRFKVDPDQLRLNNLPRYKYANAHPQYRKPTLIKQQKRSILKSHKVPTVVQKAIAMPPPPPPLSKKEHRFQQPLINSKTVCSSTPDLKSSYTSTSNTNSTVSPKVRFVELNDAKGQMADDEHSSETSSNALANMCWAKVLDSQQIRPPVLHRRSAQIRVESDDNISIFELLEQKAREGNVDMNSSCIRTFMARKEKNRQADADDSDQIVISQQMREMRLKPQVSEVISETDDDDNPDEQESTLIQTPIKINAGKAQVHVRFSDSNDTHQYSDETTVQDGTNVELFEEFKAALFQALEQRKAQPTQSAAGDEQLTQELQAKANLVRTRLEELEAEIATFKEQNAQLLRLKQQHELDKAKCAQEHLEAMERVHDEKIQAEIYLHDERMKIEEERRRFEQQMRLQKSNVNSKDKKELAALKQEVEALQLQLKQKEQTHVSAQARLRAQLRAAEKEQRNYRDEIELLGRDNKRLEQEIVKLTRDNSSKMLQEINRNIARLAPKLQEAAASAAKHTDENGKRQSKSITNILQDKSTSQQRRLNRSRKKSEPLSESYASSSSFEMDDVPMPKPAKPTKSATATGDTIFADRNKNNNNSGSNNNNHNGSNNHDNKSNNNYGENSEFKREIVNEDGSKDIWYPNGNLKKISADGMNVRMLYFNKDIKETDIRAGTVKYYYAETNTWHTTYLDGLEILEFPNGQTEHRHKNGVIEIHFPNNSIKIVDPSDTEKLEEWRYADGTHLIQLRNGDKILNLPNGQKEIHTKLNKRREYPDGTVKLVYPDGSQETRYSNGRVRLKDKDGKLIMDTDYAKY